MKVIKQMKVKQLTKQFLKQNPDTPIDDAIESAVEIVNEDPDAEELSVEGALDRHSSFEHRPTLERQATFESQASTVATRSSLSRRSRRPQCDETSIHTEPQEPYQVS